MVWPTLGSRTAKEQNSMVRRAGFMKRSGVCLSVSPVDRQQQRRAAGLLLSAPRAGDIGQQQATALGRKCGQCRVDSRGTRLNTDLFILPPPPFY